MIPIQRPIAAVLVSLALVTVGCAPAATSARPTPCAAATSLTPDDAQAMLEKLARRIRLSPEEEELRRVTSLEGARAVLSRDQALLFPAAIAFVHGQKGTEARIVEAQLETLLGESELQGAHVLSSNAAKVSVEVHRARARIAVDPERAKSNLPQRLERLVASVDEGEALAQALGTVAPTHLGRGAELMRAVAKEAPADPRVRLLVADYHRFQSDWDLLERDLTALESDQPGWAMVPYLRGLAAFTRKGDLDGAARAMRESLHRDPTFVRAQAALVLVARSPKEAKHELEKLRELNSSHYLLTLAAPSIDAALELSRL